MSGYEPTEDLVSTEEFEDLQSAFERVGTAIDAGTTEVSPRRASPDEFERFADDHRLQIRGYGSHDVPFPEYAALFGLPATRGVEPVLLGVGAADTADGTTAFSPETAATVLESLGQLLTVQGEREEPA